MHVGYTGIRRARLRAYFVIELSHESTQTMNCNYFIKQLYRMCLNSRVQGHWRSFVLVRYHRQELGYICWKHFFFQSLFNYCIFPMCIFPNVDIRADRVWGVTSSLRATLRLVSCSEFLLSNLCIRKAVPGIPHIRYIRSFYEAKKNE